MNLVNRILLLLLGAGIILGILLMCRITIPFLNFKYDQGFLLTKQNVLHSDLWRYSFYIHITSSLLVIIAGLLQFSSWILNKFPRFHRTLGKTYVMVVLVLSAPTGLVMGFYANGGIPSKISFVTIALLWWIFTFLAFRRIIKRQVQSHINWMVRSYALTLSALALRTYVVLLPHFIHLSAKESYTLVAYLSWIPNLLLAEWLIKKRIFTH